MHDEVLELFLDLDATEEQFNAPFLYGSARDGVSLESPSDSVEDADMQLLFKAIVENVPAPETRSEEEFQMLVSNIDWSDYVGRIAIGKILSGNVASSTKKSNSRLQRPQDF